MLHDKKYGLFLGDSILHGYLDNNVQLHQKFKDHFDLGIIETDFRKGKTICFLASEVFPRQMAKIVNENDCDCERVLMSWVEWSISVKVKTLPKENPLLLG